MIMMKIRKGFSPRVLYVIIATVFLLITCLNSLSFSKEALRVEIGSRLTRIRFDAIISILSGRRYPVESFIDGTIHKVDLQIPAGLDLNAKVEAVTFVFDVDKTLTSSGIEEIDDANLQKIIRCFHLMKQNPNLSIKIILLSGSAYKSYVETRFGPKISEWLFTDSYVSPEARQEIIEELRREGRRPEEVSAIPFVRESIEKRVIRKIQQRMESEGLEEYLSNIEAMTISGSETAGFDKNLGVFVYSKEKEKIFTEKEQLETARALSIAYLEELGDKTGGDYKHSIALIEKAGYFLGKDGINAIFEEAIKGIDVRFWPFDSETAIIFHDEKGVDGQKVARNAMDKLEKKGVIPQNRKYFSSGGSNFTKITLFDKAQEMGKIQFEGVLVAGGDSLTDNFLWENKIRNGIFVYFGKRVEIQSYDNVIVALDGNGNDNVRHKGSGILISHVLDIMESGGVWGDVKFCNNRYSPYEVISGFSAQLIDDLLKQRGASKTVEKSI